MKPSPLSQFPRGWPRRRAGVALIIILAFVVILTGVILAFFSRAIWNRSISNASASQTKVDLLAEGAADDIIGDLQQEIEITSSTVTTGSATIYLPLTPASMLPQMSGTVSSSITSWAPNFLIRSASNQNFYSGASSSIPSNAIAVSSTTPSLNGRSVSLARWNSHYLLPLLSSTDATPLTTGTGAFAPPDWVLVARNGLPATTWTPALENSATNGNTVIGRYAYAIYHEGGLLDANVAGYPLGTSSPAATGTNQFAYKPASSYADLTQLGLTQSQVDQLVAWRNYASAQVQTASYQSPGFTQASGSNYYNYVISNPSGFMTVSTTTLNNNGVLSPTAGQSDRMFGSRQELIAFMEQGLGLSGTSLGVLNYLTTFSRDLDQPSIISGTAAGRPVVTAGYGNNATGGDVPGLVTSGSDGRINPTFLLVRRQVATTAATSVDGSLSAAGDPVVKKRFPLDRIAWVTFKGPIATGTGTSGALSTDPDLAPVISAYLAQGLTNSFLMRGTSTNIYNAFGLTWDGTNGRWIYRPGGVGILTLGGGGGNNVANQARAADFFELLKASVTVGAVTRASISGTNATGPSGSVDPYQPLNWEFNRDESVDLAYMQLGANIIDQFTPDNYPTRINFNDGTVARDISGIKNLPYLYRVRTGMLKLREANPATPPGTFNYSASTLYGLEYTNTNPTDNSVQVNSGTSTLTDTGVAAFMLMPEIWNPHDQNTATSGSSSPTQFRVVVDSTDPDDIGNGSLYNRFNVFCWKSTYQRWSDQTSGQYQANIGPSGAGYVPFTRGPNGSGTQITGGFSGMSRVLSGTNLSLSGSTLAANSVMTFTATNQTMFREPTLLYKPNCPSGSNLAMDATTTLSDPDIAPFVTGAGLQSVGTPDTTMEPNPPAGGIYVGIPLGLVPLRWIGPRTYPPFPPPTNPTNYIHTGLWATPYGGGTRPGGTLGPVTQEPYLTMSLQYQNTSGQWVTYDSKYTSVEDANLTIPQGAGQYYYPDTGPITQNTVWTGYVDPRTPRFGPFLPPYNPTSSAFYSVPPVPPNWLDTVNGYTETDRPDAGWDIGVVAVRWNSLMGAGWHVPSGSNPTSYKGYLSQNTTVNSFYYSDADTVVRRAMGAYVASSSTTGLPMATATTYPAGTRLPQSSSRPIVLNRPFRTVAELGYAFSGNPWRNADMFTAESGYAGLLDVFCIDECTSYSTSGNSLVAGKVNLNTRQAPVVQAILESAYKDELGISGTTILTTTLANSIATALLARTSGTSGTSAAPKGPLENVSGLVGTWVSGTSTSAIYDGFSNDLSSILTSVNDTSIERFREATIRALSNSGQTRVWNLMIDVVAQTGRYPTGAQNAAAFMVEGEQRYWVHVAIDRFTGQIIDKQIEIVKE